MRRMILVAGLLLLFGVALSGSAQPAVGGSHAPLKGSLSGSWDLNYGLYPEVMHVDSTGTITHFGSARLVEYASLTLGTSGDIWSGGWTLTAANGDQMSGTSAGGCDYAYPNRTCVLHYTSTGGTGRFARASATFAATVHLTFVHEDPVKPFANGVDTSTLVGHLSR